MGLLKRLFGRDDESVADVPIQIDVEARRNQLVELEGAVDAMTQLMRSKTKLMENPGWRAKITEFDMVASEAMQLRKTAAPSREALLDLAFEVRPAVKGPEREGLEDLVVVQDRALAAANALIEVLPSERA
jgi:hypothetical protein